MPLTSLQEHAKSYADRLANAIHMEALARVEKLGLALREAWQNNRSIYICGNGGSAGNAIHLANDFIFGAGITSGRGLKIEALSANSAVITAVANDIGYAEIFAEQLRAKAVPGDVLIVLSGSGDSTNVVKALEIGNVKGLKTFAILGYSGGRCKELAQHSIHFEIADMQISEDLQLVVGHICMQWLRDNPIDRPSD